MKPSQSIDYMFTMINDYWNKSLGYKILFQNINAFKPTTDEPYLVCHTYHTDSDRVCLTGLDGKGRYRESGYLFFDMYVPSNTGITKSLDLADEIINLFRRPPLDCQITFSDWRKQEAFSEFTNFTKLTIRISFSYDNFV